MTDAHHLAQMANDIGNFFRAQPHECVFRQSERRFQAIVNAR